MTRMRISKAIRWIMASGFCVALMSGCSSWGGGVSNPFQTSQQVSAPAPYSQSSSSSQASSQTQYYTEFQDIAIPSEMSVVPGDSFIVQNGPRRVGILMLKGRVDAQSLFSFFKSAMARDGWTHKGEFQYLRSIMIYEKPDRMCIINIQENTIYTYAEIYVAPTGKD